MRLTKIIPYLVFLSFIFLFTNDAKSQFNRFGFNASLLYSDWEGEKAIDSNITYDGKIGYSVGVYSVKEFNSHWNLSYGINLSLKGFKMNGQLLIPGVALAVDVINHSVYIDAPLSVRYVFGEYGPSGLFVSAGFEFSYLVYNTPKGTLQYNGTNYYGDPESNADQLNRVDLTLFPAIGYQFSNGLNFQFSYEYGLLDPVKEDDYLGVTKASNSVFRIQVALDL